MAITLTDNTFFTGLSNLALLMRLYATNTSKKPEDFVNAFATETLGFGDTKIFPFADLPAVTDYSETSSLLTVTKVPTNEETITLSTHKVIKSSYNTYILTEAFTDASGMNNFVGYILGQMESAKTNYIYDMIITDLFGKTFTGKKQNREIKQYAVTGLTELADINAGLTLNQKLIAIGIQNDINNIQVYSKDYNAKAYTQALDIGDLRLIVTDPFNNEAVVNLFASLLKSDVVEKSFDKPEKLVIPEIKVPVGQEKVIGWLMHKRTYQFFYGFVFMGSFFDESNLCINNFLHFKYGKGFLDNLPAVKFTKGDMA